MTTPDRSVAGGPAATEAKPGKDFLEAVGRALRLRLERLRPRQLRELADRHDVRVDGMRKKELIDALATSVSAPRILLDLDNRDRVPPLTPEDASRVRGQLTAARDAIGEASNLGAAVGAAEDAWKAGEQALDEGDLEAAEADAARAAQRATEARERRIREIESSLAGVADHIRLARDVGADVGQATNLLEEARQAFAAEEHPRADDLVKRAERAAMEAQRVQIERAIQLREAQVERTEALIASCEPLLQEAEAYGIRVAEVRTLLRQARDVLAKGDYLEGITFARNAQEAAYRLEVQVSEERARRGIKRPVPGVCGGCGSDALLFYDDGWGRCSKCGRTFRWRAPSGVRERVRGLLGS